MDLYKKETSLYFYDSRYLSGYMQEWSIAKQEKIAEVIKGLNLPKTGDALDFGCGNGVLTDVIRKALPGWNVCGTDISPAAIKNATIRFPQCVFFTRSDEKSTDKKFDFLFSHHTLEHVCDISNTWNEMNGFIKESGSMLHILPCGNKDSFEYGVCRLKRRGIDNGAENRYFFEEEGHLRRLNTEEMNLFAEKYKLSLNKGYYANQYYGAIDWISRMDTAFVLRFTGLRDATGIKSVFKLIYLRLKLGFLNLLVVRVPYALKGSCKCKRSARSYFLFPIAAVLYPISRFVDSYLKRAADIEWKMKKLEKNGSEMYLFYARDKYGS